MLAHIDPERSLPLVSSVYTSIHPSILPVFSPVWSNTSFRCRLWDLPQPEAMKRGVPQRRTGVQLSHMLSSNLCCGMCMWVYEWQLLTVLLRLWPAGMSQVHKASVKSEDKARHILFIAAVSNRRFYRFLIIVNDHLWVFGLLVEQKQAIWVWGLVMGIFHCFPSACRLNNQSTGCGHSSEREKSEKSRDGITFTPLQQAWTQTADAKRKKK